MVAGIDEMSVDKFSKWFRKEGETLIEGLLQVTYQPQSIRQVEIPKHKGKGGVRKLGIQTVTDRIIQQAISQILKPIYERKFSDNSYGFRSKRITHQALQKASEYLAEGREVLVDMDLKSFFDEVNHDRLMYQLSETIKDKILLRLIRKYLRSGILLGGLIEQRQKGTPRGSPLSSLLSNIVLDELEKELENRGHCFIRYADDFLIFVRSQKERKIVKESIGKFIENKLKLKVNETKSKVCYSNQTTFLGYTIQRDSNLSIAEDSVLRLKSKIRKIAKRNRLRSFEQIISELNPVLRVWLQYFRYSKSHWILRNLDSLIHRKLLCYRIKQTKKTIGLQRFLAKQGVAKWNSWILALSGNGYWRKSGSSQAHQAMNLKWFEEQVLYSLLTNHELLNN